MEPVKILSRSVKDRAVIVTGAASGMGRATAHLFASEGAAVAVTDVNESGVAQVVDEIKAEGGNAHGWVLDILDRTAIKRVVEEIAAHFGRLDIIINNAGFGAFRRIDDEKFDAAWDK